MRYPRSIHPPPIAGEIRNLTYNSQNNTLKIRGLLHDSNSGKSIQKLEVLIDQKPAKIIEFHQFDPVEDANENFNHGRYSNEFFVIADPQRTLSAGWPNVEMIATFTDGTKLMFDGETNRGSRFHVQRTPTRHFIFAALIAIGILTAYTKSCQKLALKLAVGVDRYYNKILISLISVFLILVMTGINGGAIGKLKISPVGHGVTDIIGFDGKLFKLRNIRGDEGAILVPNSLAQLHSNPRFPIVNHNIGLDGQNMGVIGMTGVPIWQIAAIARPATWGYFFLPLRQALSWQWNLPFFSCLIGLWILLNNFNSIGKGYNLALAFSFSLAPYAAAWSNWPLYTSFFPIGVLIAWIHLLKGKYTSRTIVIGCIIGWLLSAWVLVLYPPWQITVGTLTLMIGAGYTLDNRDRVNFGVPQCIGLLVGLTLAALLISSWWLDTRTAINEVSSTVYPGQRSALPGGTGTLSWLLRGFTNAETLSFGTGPNSNESEMSSYFYIPWIIAFLGIWKGSKKNQNYWSVRALIIFFAFYFLYYFIGFPSWLSTVTLWGRVPTDRADLALGLACTLMLMLLWNQSKISTDSEIIIDTHWSNLVPAMIASIASGAIVYTTIDRMNNEIFSRNSSLYEITITIAVIFMTWWMVRARFPTTVGMIILLCVISVAGFNPIFISPKSISLDEDARRLLENNSEKHLHRTLFVGSGEAALQLSALGVPMVNGIFYYPQPSLWIDLRLHENQRNIINRYQHLDFRLKNLAGKSNYEVNSERLDQVVITLDPRNFDFSQIEADRVMTIKNDHESELLENPSLKKIGMSSGIIWFSVVSGTTVEGDSRATGHTD